jgi:hypothetical protein
MSRIPTSQPASGATRSRRRRRQRPQRPRALRRDPRRLEARHEGRGDRRRRTCVRAVGHQRRRAARDADGGQGARSQRAKLHGGRRRRDALRPAPRRPRHQPRPGETAAQPRLEKHIRAAQAAGVFVVTAAGNYGSDLVARPAYPASTAGRPHRRRLRRTGGRAVGLLQSRRVDLARRARRGTSWRRHAEPATRPCSGPRQPPRRSRPRTALLTAARPGPARRDDRAGCAPRFSRRRQAAALAGKVRNGLLDVGAAMAQLLAQAQPNPQPAAPRPTRPGSRRCRCRCRC